MFPVNGSLLMAPLFPQSGPDEFGSPMSTVVLRCYDFPARIPGQLFVSLPVPTLPSSVRVSQPALTFRAGVIVQPATQLPACSYVDVCGISRFPGDPSCAFASVQDPGRNRRSLAY